MSATIYQRDSYLLLADGTRWPVAGNLAVNSETETMRVLNAYKPDIGWQHTDSHGHLHQYVRDEEDVPRLPSLERRSVLVECNGSCGDEVCDGYHETEWHCRECDDLVEPGFVHDYDVEMGGIPVSRTVEYVVTVEAHAELGAVIEGASFAYVDDSGTEQRHPLPPLHAGLVEATSGPDGSVVRSHLHATEYRSVNRKPVGP